jgi:[protein-PII] uridylyltransferase
VTRDLTRLNLQISSAKITTYGEKVVDVFYVKNLFGHKVEQPGKLSEIRRSLEAVLAKGNEATPETVRERVAAE